VAVWEMCGKKKVSERLCGKKKLSERLEPMSRPGLPKLRLKVCPGGIFIFF